MEKQLKAVLVDLPASGNSPTIHETVLCLTLQTFLYLATIECNITSDWLNHTV